MTAPVAQPADQSVREQALDPERSFIVEAPAGSGKTELLTRRFLRLLAVVRAPEEILAITFTRKAAAEMRNRILNALALAERATPEKESQRPIWELARAVRAADAKQGWRLLAHPARLRIMTIDALNGFLAKQLPLLSGAGAALNISRDAQQLYAETVLRLIERLGARDSVADTVARLLRHLDNRYEILESLLSQELARREHWLDVGLMRFDLLQLRVGLEAALSSAITDELAILRDSVPLDVRGELVALATHAAAVLNGQGVASEIAACDSLRDLPAALPEALPQWRGLAELLLTDRGEWRKKPNKNQGFPPDDKPTKNRVEALLARLQREPELERALHRARQMPVPRYGDAQWQVLTDLLDVLKLAIAEFDVVTRERGEADYVANSIAARRALGSVIEPTDLALRLDYRLRHLLVDEFQDTSRGQIELLALLTAGWSDGDGRTLFCVGDPMQSIYRFRQADVGLFLNLKRHGLNQLRLAPLRLTVNFRSAKPVLDWVNATFERTLPQRDDPERGAVGFTASDPHAAADTQGGVFVHAMVGDRLWARDAEAKQVAALIGKIQTERPEAKLAVLVSSRPHLHWLIAELRAHDIAFNAVEFDPLAERPAIQDLIALTRAVVHLADRTAWLAVLRAPWCGLSLADLHALCGNRPANETVWQWINDAACMQRVSADGQERIARIGATLGAAVMLRGRVNLRDCVERAWHALGGPATLATKSALQDCAAYFARLVEIERSGDIEDIARLEKSLSDLYATTDTESAGARVELMTIHRAKGLEYDIVILPALDGGARKDDPPLLRTQELSRVGDRALLLAPIAARGEAPDPIYAWLEHLDRERARLEKGRLLYVAATRARRELHLFGAVKQDGKPHANTFLRLLWPSIESHFAGASIAPTPAVNVVAVVDSAIRTRRLPLAWKLPEPIEPVGKSELRDIVADEPLRPDFEWVGETARHVGTLVHRELERMARLSLGADGIHLEARYEIELAELGVPPHLRASAGARVIQALTQMLSDERGRWLLANSEHREAASELALSGVIDGSIVNGVIDRTFVTQEGVRWIVDFKTSTHAGGGREEFLSNEVERYRKQLQRYAALMRAYRPGGSIKAALYFPLLAAWREVAV